MMSLDKPLIYEGILAREGIHRNPRTGQEEKITYEELKRQHTLYPSFPIIVSGPEHHGLINPQIAVGKVESRLDDTIRGLRAKYIIFREQEAQDRLTEELKRKLAAGAFVPASMTYTATLDEQGTQRGRKPDHVAIGVKRPMHEGIGIHAEEDLPEDLRWEDTEGIGEDKAPAPEKIELSKAELQEVVKQAVQAALDARPLPVETASPKEEVKEEEAPKEAVAAPVRPEPAPDVGLPASAPAPKTAKVEGLEVLDDGWWKIG